jgi:hypothetical protein
MRPWKVVALAVLTSASLILSSTLHASAATPKKGAVCSKLGQTSGKGSKKLTCSPVTSLRWIATPIKPPIGSIFSPAPMGKVVKVGNVEFAIKGVDFEIGSEICAENPFNEGCALGPKLQGTVDLNSDVRWIGIDIEIENGFEKALTPSSTNYIFYLVDETNNLIENNIAAVIPNNLLEISVKEGEKGIGKIAFAVPKKIDKLNPLLLIRDQSKSTPKDYYFLLDW